MEYQYHGIGFLAFVGLFFLAGFLGLFRTWLGIAAATIVAAVANYLMDDTALGLIAGTAGGLATGVGGAVIIPLLRAGSHARPALNSLIVNRGTMGRSSLRYNWLKNDNIEGPGSES